MLLTNALVYDGMGGPPFEGWVRLDGTTIADVGPSSATPQEGADTLDVGGRALLPGLLDAHIHLALAILNSPEASSPRSEEVVARCTVRAMVASQHALRTGVMAVRDTGSSNHSIHAVREASSSGQAAGPLITAAGLAISMSGGHGSLGAGRTVTGIDEVRRAVREEIAAGAGFIKLMASAGVGTPRGDLFEPQLSYGEIRAAVREAQRSGVRVAAHATGSVAASVAVRAGVSSIEHGVDLDKATLREMAHEGVAYVPTLENYRRFAQLGSSLRVPETITSRARGVVEPHQRTFRDALEMGVPIMVGTDSGHAAFPIGPDSMPKEIQAMVALGMSIPAVVASATKRPAEWLGLSNRGGVAPGLIADLLVLDGNPAEDATAFDRPWLIIRGGQALASTSSPAVLDLEGRR